MSGLNQKKGLARGLGKGINILIPEITEEAPVEGESVRTLSINEVEPNREQPRKVFEEEALRELADSISLHGIIQPLIVRSAGDYYEIVAGERRWRAARMAGLNEVPVIVRDFDELNSLEVALIENLQRENLSGIEEATAYKRLQDEFGLTQEGIAEKVGKKRSTVANSLRLLNLPEAVLSILNDGKISVGHAKALLTIENPSLQIEAANRIIAQEMSVRQAEELVKTLLYEDDKIPRRREVSSSPYEAAYRGVEREMSGLLGTRVKLLKGKKKSKIEIEFFTDDDLDRILKLFKKMED